MTDAELYHFCARYKVSSSALLHAAYISLKNLRASTSTRYPSTTSFHLEKSANWWSCSKSLVRKTSAFWYSAR